MDSMGLSPEALEEYLNRYCRQSDGCCVHEPTGRPVSACVPVHTFGHPCRIDAIASLCREWGVALVEDAAESLGSLYKGSHVGLFGELGILSFNGNKIITGGGGGAILSNSEDLAAWRQTSHDHGQTSVTLTSTSMMTWDTIIECRT